MKNPLLATTLTLFLAAGCATTQETRTTWEVQPANVVRHGMAEAMAQHQLGRVFQSQGRWDAAEVAFGKAIVADPRNADAHAALGVLYAERGELRRAMESFRKAAELAPDEAYAHNNVGYALHLAGRHAEAVTALRTALMLDPAYDRAWTNLRKAAEGAGMTEVAELAAQHRLAPAVAMAAVPADAVLPMQPLQPTPPAQPGVVTPTPAVAALVGAPLPVSELAPRAEPVIPPASPTTSVEAPPEGTIHMTEVPFRQPAAAVSAPAATVTASMAGQTAETVAPPIRREITGRVELANANGVPRFATRLGKQLRKEGIRVSRIINHRSFQLRRSVIEYRPKAAESAMALRERLGSRIALKRVPDGRVQSELRVVLGRDTLPHLAAMIGPVKSAAADTRNTDASSPPARMAKASAGATPPHQDKPRG